MRCRFRHPYRRTPCLTRSKSVPNSHMPSISLDLTRTLASTRQFLYPSEEDLYKLVRFLVGKLSGAPTSPLRDEDSRSCSAKSARASESSYPIVDPKSGLRNVDISSRTKEQHNFTPPVGCSRGDHSLNLWEGLRKNASGDQDRYQGEVLKKPMEPKHSNLQHLDQELQLLRAASEMVFDDQHPVDFHIGRLNNQLEAKRHKLKELESEWDSVKKPLLEKKGNLEQALLSSGKHMRMKEIELETESISAEIKKREEELSKLSSDHMKQPKLAPKRFYIERVNEITKNSKKQDNDMQRILKDTRELQLESNTIQERLNRTYAVLVDGTIFREANKDDVTRQAYRLVTNIHESFEEITEKILATDRTRRDAADYEAKLATIKARSLNMGKLQEDLDTIRKENELLEQRLL